MKNLRFVLAAVLLLAISGVVQAQFQSTNDGAAATITGYTGAGGAVVIPSTISGLPVASIGDNAFQNATTLTNLTIPSGVSNIGYAAFAGCVNLAGVEIPGSVTNIGQYAFYQCGALAFATIDSGVTNIGNYAFEFCTNLATVTISGTVTNIGIAAFSSCSNLTSLTLSSGVADIGEEAFAYCTSLQTVVVPGSVTNIGDYVFLKCTNLTSATVPGSVVNLSDQFSGCLNLQNIALDSGVTNIAAQEFYGVSALTNITIPASVTSIGTNAFSGTGLIDITIPDGVTRIDDFAFSLCTNLTSVTFSAGLRSIGADAFYDDAALTLVAIPDGVTNIGREAFRACSNLTEVTIPESVTTIGDIVFYECTNLISATIPGSITNLGNNQFLSCPNLRNVAIDAGAGNINSNEFIGVNLVHVTIPDSVTNIGVAAFYHTPLTNIVIPGNVALIDESAFYQCTSLLSVTLSNGIGDIGPAAFLGCSNLGSIIIPGSITNLEQSVFQQCQNLTNVTILDGLKGIRTNAFFACSNLTRVTLPPSLTNLEGQAFVYCVSLATVFFQGNPPPVFGNPMNAYQLTFYLDNSATAYYLPGATGWGTTYGSLKTSRIVPLSFPIQPHSLSGVLGTDASLNVSVTGNSPYYFQWQFDGKDIPGANSSALPLSNLQVANQGSYALVVSNYFDEVATSAVATVTVLLPPSLSAPPQSLTVSNGLNTDLSVMASGTLPLHYQWQLNGMNIASATNNILPLNNIQLTNAGSYDVVVTNNYGKLVSAVVAVAVLAPPSITAQPQSTGVVLGADPALSVGVTGTAPLNYQWQFDGTNIAGATNIPLVINNFQATNAGSYAIVVTNLYGATTSSVATVIVVAAPSIITQPASQKVEIGSNATLNVMAVGLNPLSYQWRFNGVKLANGAAVAGATNATLVLKHLATANAGSYTVVVTNSLGAATSIVATITVLIPPAITVSPVSLTEPLAGIAAFSVQATGSPLTYQWLFNGAFLSNGGSIFGATSNVLRINPVMSSNVGSYSVVVSNPATNVTSKVVQLTLGHETARPSVVIISPRANSRATNIILNGTASDLVRVLNVKYWLTNVNQGVITISSNLALLTPGTGAASNWTIQPTLLPGTNILAVQSSNYAGLGSPLTSVAFFYQVKSPLQIIISPAGEEIVKGAALVLGDAAPTNGGMLYVGERYTITATPVTNWYLTNWAENGNVVSTNSILAFTMESNLVLTANFATNLFAGAAARYDGIFYLSDAQGFTEATSGLIENLQLKNNGVYSGKLYLAGASYALSGGFDRSGNVTETISRASVAGGSVTLRLNIPWGSTPREITGSVQGTNFGGWNSTNLGLIAATTNTSNFPAYTVLLPQDPNNPHSPPGDGYMLVTNTGSMINMGGILADGTPFSRSEPINEDDQFPVYASLYNNTGLLIGRLSLSSGVFGAVPAGGLAWIKPPQKSGLYTNGFNTGLGADGSAWTNSEAVLDGLFPNGAQLAISGGGLSNNLAYTLQLTTTNTFRLTGGSPDYFSGSLNPVNGQLSFTFTNSFGKRVSASGAVLPNSALGGGFFVGVTNAGIITLTPLHPSE